MFSGGRDIFQWRGRSSFFNGEIHFQVEGYSVDEACLCFLRGRSGSGVPREKPSTYLALVSLGMQARQITLLETLVSFSSTSNACKNDAHGRENL